MAADTVRIALFAISIFVYCLCFGSAVIWSAYRFYANADNLIIKKRNYKFTIVHSVVGVVFLTFYSPLWLLSISDFDEQITEISDILQAVLFPLVTYGFGMGIVIRYWLICFKFNLIESTQSAKWKNFINTSYTDHNNWFIKNINTLGSLPYISKAAFVYVIVCSLIFWFIKFYPKSVYTSMAFTIFSFFTYLAILLPIIVMWKNTPSIHDHIFYLAECRIFIIICSIYMVFFLLIRVSPMLGISDYARYSLTMLNGAVAYFALSLFQLQFPLHKLKSKESFIEKKSSELNEQILLRDIMSGSHTLNSFMDHIGKEFSIECALSFIEFTQFKRVIDRHLHSEDSRIVNENELCILNNKEIPKSFIVYGDMQVLEQDGCVHSDDGTAGTDRVMSIKRAQSTSEEYADWNESTEEEYGLRAHLLFKKYIEKGSDLQINISFRDRIRLTEMLSVRQDAMKLNAEVLFEIWDAAIREMWTLMLHSSWRFKSAQMSTNDT